MGRPSRRRRRAPTTSPSAASSPRPPSRRGARAAAMFGEARRLRLAGRGHRRHHPGERAPSDRRRRRRGGGDQRPVRCHGHRRTRGAVSPTSSTSTDAAMSNEELSPSPEDHSRRRQFAGARVPLRRRHAALHRARRRRLRLGRRRQALHRLRRFLGADDPRPRPSRRGRRVCSGGRGLSFGAPTEAEIEIAEELLCQLRAGMEQVRLVSSGTEATMSALRLARGFTGRDRDRQVRRLLPRPRRQPAGQGRLGRADLRQSHLGRRAGRPRAGTPWCSTTTMSRSWTRLLRGTRRRNRLRSSSSRWPAT